MDFKLNHPDDKCTAQVNRWVDQNSTGLDPERILALFEAAIRALERRTLVSLSEVTFLAILDRVLLQCQKAHPLLASVKIEENKTSLADVLTESAQPNSEQLVEAFRCFLLNLLTVLGSLTGGVLTKPLCTELAQIKIENIPAKSRKNREDI